MKRKPYYETPLGKLYHGDCLEIMPQLEPVDLVLTDPPYFLPAKHYVATRKRADYTIKTLADRSILKTYFNLFFNQIDKSTRSTGTFYVFCDGQSYPVFYDGLFEYCKNIRPIIWDKIISYNGYTWRHQHEIIIWGERDDSERIPTGDGDIIKMRGVLQKDRSHPAEKPKELFISLINKHENYKFILDPFIGSGTTAIACERLNRKWIGIEIEEKYCEIAAKRIEQERKQLKLF